VFPDSWLSKKLGIGGLRYSGAQAKVVIAHRRMQAAGHDSLEPEDHVQRVTSHLARGTDHPGMHGSGTKICKSLARPYRRDCAHCLPTPPATLCNNPASPG
jgi:hypothetical protein